MPIELQRYSLAAMQAATLEIYQTLIRERIRQ
jgi:hypothetical protein